MKRVVRAVRYLFLKNLKSIYSTKANQTKQRRVLRVLVNHEPIDRSRSSQISSIRAKKNVSTLIRINRFETKKISRKTLYECILYDCEFQHDESFELDDD